MLVFLNRFLDRMRGEGSWFTDGVCLALLVGAFFIHVDRPQLSDMMVVFSNHPIAMVYRTGESDTSDCLTEHSTSIFLLLERIVRVAPYYPGWRTLTADVMVGTGGSHETLAEQLARFLPVDDPGVDRLYIRHSDPGPKTVSGVILRYMLSGVLHMARQWHYYAAFQVHEAWSHRSAKDENTHALIDYLMGVTKGNLRFLTLQNMCPRLHQLYTSNSLEPSLVSKTTLPNLGGSSLGPAATSGANVCLGNLDTLDKHSLNVVMRTRVKREEVFIGVLTEFVRVFVPAHSEDLVGWLKQRRRRLKENEGRW
ncbi:hypothetical protein KIPB_001566 [Kipferlia bialata]|uniref:Uncharacterized protein n=1 Tax=Kipferlia bialata TaxID=797122 RepID=A0A9K3GFC2_9EUKA|nr:hypothetical protein KIPB_001566 [Kipferlia bialata]|eukprot:g1566.t1